MKKQLIAIGLLSFLAVPSVVFAEGDACAPLMSEGMTEEAVMAAKSAAMNTSECMGQRLGSMEEFSHGHGVSLYGSFRTGLIISGGETDVSDLSSNWGFQGSAEVSEGLTAAFRYEGKLDTGIAEAGGGVGHGHAEVDESVFVDLDTSDNTFSSGLGDHDMDTETDDVIVNACSARGDPIEILRDDKGEMTGYETLPATGGDVVALANGTCGKIIHHAHAEEKGDSGPGGRLSYVDLSGGFGTIRMGQIWSASANHYYFKVDPSHWAGKTGGASTRNPNSISYSSSAGDVAFQIDKVTGDKERVEFGATAALGPVVVGVGYWKSGVEDDESSFTGVALQTGAAGVNLTVGLGSSDNEEGVNSDTTIIALNGSVGDSGLSYGVQIANSKDDSGDQNLFALTNSLGSGASLIFELSDPGGDAESTSVIGLRVDF